MIFIRFWMFLLFLYPRISGFFQYLAHFRIHLLSTWWDWKFVHIKDHFKPRNCTYKLYRQLIQLRYFHETSLPLASAWSRPRSLLLKIVKWLYVYKKSVIVMKLHTTIPYSGLALDCIWVSEVTVSSCLKCIEKLFLRNKSRINSVIVKTLYPDLNRVTGGQGHCYLKNWFCLLTKKQQHWSIILNLEFFFRECYETWYKYSFFQGLANGKSVIKVNITVTTFVWPLTLKDDLDLSPLKMCSSMRYTCMPNIKLLSSILQKLWPMCLDFVFFTFDLEGWPWPFTTQNVQLHEIHMHAKYQVAIFNIAKVMANVLGFCFFYLWPWRSSLTLTFSPLKMFRSMRYTWTPPPPKKKNVFWPWRMTLTFHHSKCAGPWDTLITCASPQGS